MSAASAPLRVLHIIPTLTGGGAENFLCALVPAFDERVVQAGVMAIYPTRVPLERGLPVIKIERRGRYDPGFLGRMTRGIRAFAPDIVHAHLHNGKYWGRLTAIAAGVPVVVFTEHNPCGEKRMLAEILVDGVVNQFTDGIATFAQAQRSLLARAEWLPQRKVVVIENGIRLPPLPSEHLRARARVRLEIGADTIAVLVVARLIERKNQQLAIAAMQHLPPHVREVVKLFVIGEGEDAAMLAARARDSAVAGRISLMGNRDDAIDLLYGGDVFYMPSLAEGMPLAMLEAMSVGLPVVSAPWIGVAELLQGGALGTITQDWSPQSSAEVFSQFVSRPEPFAAKARRAMEFVRSHHDIVRTARAHEAWYRELARKHRLAAAS